MYNEHTIKVSKKGKMKLPKSLIAKYGSDKLYISVKPQDAHLQAYTPARWEIVQAMLDSLPETRVNTAKRRYILSSTYIVDIRKTGIIIPLSLLKYASITDKAIIKENNEGFEIQGIGR